MRTKACYVYKFNFEKFKKVKKKCTSKNICNWDKNFDCW